MYVCMYYLEWFLHRCTVAQVRTCTFWMKLRKLFNFLVFFQKDAVVTHLIACKNNSLPIGRLLQVKYLNKLLIVEKKPNSFFVRWIETIEYSNRAILLQVEKSGLSPFPRKATFLKATFDSVNSALNIFNFIMDMLRFV